MLKFKKDNIARIAILILVLILSLSLINNLFKSDTTILDDVKLKESEPSNNGFALMLQQTDGTYEESDSNTWPTGMKFNSEKSGCIDVNGNKIDNALSFDTSTNAVMVSTNKTAYCYLYFDLDNSVYAKVVSDYTNGNGVSKLSDSDKGSRTYDTYYYTGNITNNNVLYAEHCWKMVITTEGNGVKMIYNGVPTDGSCDNSGTSSHIETTNTAFNSSYNSPAYVGYMYNKVYTASYKSMSSNTTAYVYGNSVTWNGSNYTLETTTSGAWSSVYSSLSNNHYTCFTTGTTCSEVYYIDYASSSGVYYLTLTGGVDIEEALNEMLYAEDVNTTDSTIKATIDSWYESKLLNKTDSSGNKYSSYLQNTIYCNNRATTSLGAFDPNGGSNTSNYYMYFNYNTLDCENTRDQFTLKTSAGGEEGYGNNALDYPIGLISYKEANLAQNGSSTNYLNNNSYFWLLSPDYFFDYRAVGWLVYYGPLLDDAVNSTVGVRPAVSLGSSVKIKSGDGSVTSPYIVGLT